MNDSVHLDFLFIFLETRLFSTTLKYFARQNLLATPLETGLDIDIKNIVGVYTRLFPERHGISIVFLCSLKAGDLRLNQEHSDVKFLSTKKGNARVTSRIADGSQRRY